MRFHFPTFSKAATLILLACTTTSVSKPHCDKLSTGEYIVELGNGVDLKQFLRGKAFKPSGEFKFLNAFVAHLSLTQITALCQHPSVAHITENAILEPAGNTLSQKLPPEGLSDNEHPWNLHRLNLVHPIPIDDSQQKKVWNRPFTFQNDVNAGDNVDIYILDTGMSLASLLTMMGLMTHSELQGVFVEHTEFGGRARHGWSYVKDTTDYRGHGTHVAGIAASSQYGVATKAQIISVKFSGGTSEFEYGMVDNLVGGMQYIVTEHAKRKPGRNSVVNISQRFRMMDTKEKELLGRMVKAEELVDRAIKIMVRLGIHVVVSAGNTGTDEAQHRTPARVEEVITVGASTYMDARAEFSDWGKAVDIFAPGEEIWSTSARGGRECFSGTSMAAPHVTGIVATILSRKGNFKITPARMANMVKAMAQRNSRIKLNLLGDHRTTDLLAHLDLEELQGI